MKVAFDSWVLASRLRYNGTYVYAQNLLAQFRRMAQSSPEMNFSVFTSPRAANDAKLLESGSRFELTRSDLLAWDRLWRLGGVGVAAARSRADLIFSPTSNILPVGRVPVVCTIHDAIPIMMQVRSRKITLLLKSLMWSSAKLSRAIITDSACSRNDLLNTYRLPESKVSVVYLGYDATIFNDNPPEHDREQALLTKLGIRRAYVLHHGVIQPRKNLVRLMEAYRLVLSRNRNLELDLVLAGRLGWQYQDILAAASNAANAPGRVILAGALDDSDLAILLKRATLVVIPSLYEGFCLPMVEAMACGAPTVVANASCLPEVSGGTLRYFDPLSVEDMADCMEQVLESDETRRNLARQGKQRAARFSWQRCAEDTLQVLKRNFQS